MIVESLEGISRMAVSGGERESVASRAAWDEADFEQTFLEHFAQVVNILNRLVSDRALSEELANEVFLKFSRLIVRPTPEGNVAGWLYRTATNLGIDALRSRAKRQHYEAEAARAEPQKEDPSSDPLGEILRQEKCRRVRDVLALLKPSQAQALILRHSGFSYNELAACLGIQRGSVGTMLMRAEAEFERRFKKSTPDR